MTHPPGPTADIESAPRISHGLRVAVISGPESGRRCVIGPGELRIGSESDNGLALSAGGVSRHHLVMNPHPAGVAIRDLGSRNGTWYRGAQIKEVVVPPGSTLTVGECELLIEPDTDVPEIPMARKHTLGRLIGRSFAMRRLFTAIERVAPSDYTVLVEGETGSGKELVARAIHDLSRRASGPLVVFDCGAVSESLVESELFGHVRGAFTGAIEARTGAFRRADGGTLFIDEIQALPLALQSKLLRTLETRSVRPVGADAEVQVDLRIIAATNVSLGKEVDEGRFRNDLFYRVSVVHLPVPPLRARPEDISLLVTHFIESAGVEGPVDGPNLDRLVGHSWPGNVRELRNVIERAIALVGGGRMSFRELPVALGNATPALSWPISLELPYKDAKEQVLGAFERVYATQMLERVNRNVPEAARRSGLSRFGFTKLLKRRGLLRPGEGDPDQD